MVASNLNRLAISMTGTTTIRSFVIKRFFFHYSGVSETKKLFVRSAVCRSFILIFCSVSEVGSAKLNLHNKSFFGYLICGCPEVDKT